MSDRPIALVTGGSRGIGRAVTTRLARDGFDVALCFRSRSDTVAEVTTSAQEAGARVFARQIDVADPVQAKDLVSAVEADFGPIDAVVTCAGVVRDRPLVMLGDADWREVLGTNLDGVFHVCRAAVFAFMKRRAGTVVTMSSIAGVYGNANQTNYAASKAGIIGFTKSLAKEVGRYNIRANVVAPGFIETDMTGELSDQRRQQILERVPIGRFGQPGDVAELVAFLVSERAAYITGQVLGIDGGLVV